MDVVFQIASYGMSGAAQLNVEKVWAVNYHGTNLVCHTTFWVENPPPIRIIIISAATPPPGPSGPGGVRAS